MSGQASGISYALTYSGLLKIVEEILIIALLICATRLEYNPKRQLLLIVLIPAFVITAIILILYLTSAVRRDRTSWLWTEFSSVVTWGVLIIIASCYVLSLWTYMAITCTALGLITSIVYMFDAFDKYQLARIPRKRYYWTQPNMPDLQ